MIRYLDDLLMEEADVSDWPTMETLRAAQSLILEVDVDRGTTRAVALHRSGLPLWSLYMGYVEDTRPFLLELISTMTKKGYYHVEVVAKHGCQRRMATYSHYWACVLLRATGATSNRKVRQELLDLWELEPEEEGTQQRPHAPASLAELGWRAVLVNAAYRAGFAMRPE